MLSQTMNLIFSSLSASGYQVGGLAWGQPVFNTVNTREAPEQLAWGWMPAAKRDFTQGSSEQTVWADSSAPSEPGMWGQHRDYLPVLRNVHVKLQQLRAKHILN